MYQFDLHTLKIVCGVDSTKGSAWRWCQGICEGICDCCVIFWQQVVVVGCRGWVTMKRKLVKTVQ